MKRTLLNNVLIDDIADKGRGFARVSDKALFVDGGVPGDITNVEIFKKGKTFDEGRVTEIIKPSSFRVEPFCQHFGICGGCKWQHMNYEAQLQYKEKSVRDVMQRIAKIPDPEIIPIAGAVETRYYRNKLEYTFSNKRYLLKEEMNDDHDKDMRGLGFHIPGMFSKVLHIETCYLQDTRTNDIRLFVDKTARENNISYFDLKTQAGMLRNLVIRNTSVDEWMVMVVFRDDDPALRLLLMNSIKEKFPFITSLYYMINQKRNDSTHDQEAVLFNGKSYIIEVLENLKFKIGPKSFFQTNSRQALKLYSVTREFASLTGDETVYDLYTGTGSIAAFISAKAKKVTGIEYVKEAINDAVENAALNNITNMNFIAGDMKDILTPGFFEINGKPDVIITDPPRAGMHEDVVTRIAESGASKIVYVSCNPATQARDILLLSEKYTVTRMQPVDMFPHTAHVENVALLEKNDLVI